HLSAGLQRRGRARDDARGARPALRSRVARPVHGRARRGRGDPRPFRAGDGPAGRRHTLVAIGSWWASPARSGRPTGGLASALRSLRGGAFMNKAEFVESVAGRTELSRRDAEIA